MERSGVCQRVALLFPRAARQARSTRVAVEHELLVADTSSGATVPVEAVRAATAHAPYSAHLGFEPGGQVELSLAPADSSADISRRLREEVAAMRRDCAAAGIRLDDTPMDSRTEAEVPLQLRSPRYVAMQRHFDTIGPAGRRMMRRTASTQVCLDWWPGRAGLEQWQLHQLVGPFLAAAFTRRRHTVRECPSRLATWLAVDPARTAFDDRLLQGADPVQAYTEFAMGATILTPPDDVDQHLSTLFPPVRPRGRYLEVRYPDVQRENVVGVLVTVLATLSYDDRMRAHTLRRMRYVRGHLDEHWHGAAHGVDDVAAVGRELIALTGVCSEVLDGAA